MTDSSSQSNGRHTAPTTVLIARHGETEWNLQGRFQGHQDSPLTDKGLLQAEQLGLELAPTPLEAVFSSDLGRALLTAQRVAARHGLQVQVLPGLREIDTGAWTGLDRDEVAASWPVEREQFRLSPGTVQIPEGETFAQAQARVLSALGQVLPAYQGKRVAVITHGTILETVLAHAMGLDLGALWLRIAHHCCAHTLAFANSRLRLVQLGRPAEPTQASPAATESSSQANPGQPPASPAPR